jgi:hypothetical protein
MLEIAHYFYTTAQIKHHAFNCNPQNTPDLKKLTYILSIVHSEKKVERTLWVFVVYVSKDNLQAIA